MSYIDITIPKFPECWDSCGNCGSGTVSVDQVLVRPGDAVERDDTILVVETGKVALDIPSTHNGRVLEVKVAAGETVSEGQVILVVETLD